jgi:hypothetical protein
LHFPPPTRIGNLDLKHSLSKINGPGPLGYNRSTDQRPGKQWCFPLRRAPQRIHQDFF